MYVFGAAIQRLSLNQEGRRVLGGGSQKAKLTGRLWCRRSKRKSWELNSF